MAENATSESKPALTPDEVIASQRSRQLTIMSVVLIVLAAAVFATRQWRTPEAPLTTVEVSKFSADNVGGVEIFSGAGGDKVKLIREGDDWRLANRWNALADKEEVTILVKKIQNAKRLSKPATEDAESMSLYELAYDQAAHVVLFDKAGKEIVHLLVGKGENAMSDFVRYGGKSDPPGAFELVDLGGSLDTLRSRLKLDAEGKPQARGWVDLTVLKPLPRDITPTRVTIRDKIDGKEVLIELEGSADPTDPAKRVWQMVKPESSYGNASAVDGVLEALKGLRGTDIAGQPKTPDLGIADADKWVEVRYLDKTMGNKPASLRVDFGKRKDTEIVAYAASENRGEYVWWVSDFILGRIFRAAKEFTDVAPLAPIGPKVADGARVQHILIAWSGTGVNVKQPRTKADARKLLDEVLTKARGEGADWTALQKQYNEDDGVDVHMTFTVTPDAGLVQPFINLSLSLKVGEIGAVESNYGYHIIKRME